jgi:hypothetical protein
MKATTLFAPAALAVGMFAMFYSPDAAAHEPVSVAVGLPPVVVDAGGVHVAVGVPAPPPPQQVVVVRERPRYEEVVVVREREYYPVRETVVYVEDDPCAGHHHPKGKAHGYWKKHGGYRR